MLDFAKQNDYIVTMKFTDDSIKETIIGLLKAIKTSEYGVDEVKNVEITIDNE